MKKTLEDKNKPEKEATMIINSNTDVHRVKSGSMPGKCIINFTYIYQKLHKEFDNHSHRIECNFCDYTFIGACEYGLRNQLFFKCRMCHFESSIWNKLPPEESLNVNTGVVVGGILTGVGYTQLQESSAAMNIKFMGKKHMKRHMTLLPKHSQKLLKKA